MNVVAAATVGCCFLRHLWVGVNHHHRRRRRRHCDRQRVNRCHSHTHWPRKSLFETPFAKK